ncbi:cupin domain-containing protein [Desertimonas flava]|jgi:mannose-6-phosphate isomerase-like protein (cupin superfamily)|uniref:cupin domain-containing protein n=1 Tax=Desertimonas flava TaxID=2064846 RepID=UPI000E34D70A|nr:cupin domain-containing protein [Desertimonas flava]
MSQAAKTEPTVFSYERPDLGGRAKRLVVLGRTDISIGAVQLVDRGGENNLHSHSHLDGYWFVLEGRVRFYTTGDEVIADLGRYEGVLIPRGYPYWFESSGDVPLELLQFEASALGPGADITKDRVDHEPLKQVTLDLMSDRVAGRNAEG